MLLKFSKNFLFVFQITSCSIYIYTFSPKHFVCIFNSILNFKKKDFYLIWFFKNYSSNLQRNLKENGKRAITHQKKIYRKIEIRLFT